ncbi:MAG: universal stress protein [Steroidobacteraceae bacterium]
MKIHRILVATDFSSTGNRAVHVAAALARREAAALRILHVAPSRRQLEGFWRSRKSALRHVSGQAAVALRQLSESVDPTRELELSTGVVAGTAARKIAAAAKDYGADLLVIGARGEHESTTGQPGLGGTAIRLVTNIPCPLWLTRLPLDAGPNTVVAAIDMGDLSSAIVAWAARQARGGPLHVLHAYDVPFAARLESYGIAGGALDVYSKDEQERLEQQMLQLVTEAGCGADAHRIIARGDATSVLFAQIRKLEPNLVVLGRHDKRKRRSTHQKFGSVCLNAAFMSPTDILIIQ